MVTPGHVRAEAIAEAAKDGQGNALAIAVGKVVKKGKKKEAVSGDLHQPWPMSLR